MFDLFRSDWGAQPGSFVSIAWSARPGVETHHSVGLYGTTRAGSWMKAIERDHLARGWKGPFYNVGIYTDGTIVEGRPVTAQSGAIKDLTVVFAGDYRTRQLTDAQKQAWHKVRTHALAEDAGTRIVWHGQRDGSACPGINVINWLKTLEDDLFTEHETKELKRLVAGLDEVKSNGSFGKWAALHLREGGRHWTKAQIAAIAAGSAAGGAGASEVIQEIIRRLGG